MGPFVMLRLSFHMHPPKGITPAIRVYNAPHFVNPSTAGRQDCRLGGSAPKGPWPVEKQAPVGWHQQVHQPGLSATFAILSPPREGFS